MALTAYFGFRVMWTRQHRKSPLRHLVMPVLAAISLGYFGYHAVNGNLGLTSRQEYEAQLDRLHGQIDALAHTRTTLEKRVAALSDGTLQRDMIDEQARRQLGLVAANEVVILHDGQDAGLSLDDLVQRTN